MPLIEGHIEDNGNVDGEDDDKVAGHIHITIPIYDQVHPPICKSALLETTKSSFLCIHSNVPFMSHFIKSLDKVQMPKTTANSKTMN